METKIEKEKNKKKKKKKKKKMKTKKKKKKKKMVMKMKKVCESAILHPAVVNVAVVARSKANSMMRRWRWRGLFLGGIHGARGQELAHILRIMCLFVGLEYR